MGEKGLEPLRIEIQWLLRPPRLPVPPLALLTIHFIPIYCINN